MLAGIPLMASRVGRAVGRLLDWLESGFNAAVLRRALEAGDYSTGEHSGAVLAKELRRARAGWGREQTGRAARRMFTSASALLARAAPAGTQADLFSEENSITELSAAARRRALAELVL